MAIVPENELERSVLADPQWQEGAAWGEPRPGHPEGAIAAHIEEVLANIDREAINDADRQRLRFVALVHDTFKYRVQRDRPRTGANHHAVIARRFAERYTHDVELLELIELHDVAYNAWLKGDRGGDWAAAEARAARLLDRLGPSLPLYLRFYRADTGTGDKSPTPLAWFEQLARRSQPHGRSPPRR